MLLCCEQELCAILYELRTVVYNEPQKWQKLAKMCLRPGGGGEGITSWLHSVFLEPGFSDVSYSLDTGLLKLKLIHRINLSARSLE